MYVSAHNFNITPQTCLSFAHLCQISSKIYVKIIFTSVLLWNIVPKINKKDLQRKSCETNIYLIRHENNKISVQIHITLDLEHFSSVFHLESCLFEFFLLLFNHDMTLILFLCYISYNFLIASYIKFVAKHFSF